MQVERTVYTMTLMRKCQFRESRFLKISEEDPTVWTIEKLQSYIWWNIVVSEDS
jgi:O-glycosyl hydrolase